MRKRTRRELRLQYEYQQGQCCWCLEQMDMTRQGRGENLRAATWEHIKPQCMGGKHELANMVLAHAICNQRRGSKILLVPKFQSYTLGEPA